MISLFSFHDRISVENVFPARTPENWFLNLHHNVLGALLKEISVFISQDHAFTLHVFHLYWYLLLQQKYLQNELLII